MGTIENVREGPASTGRIEPAAYALSPHWGRHEYASAYTSRTTHFPVGYHFGSVAPMNERSEKRQAHKRRLFIPRLKRRILIPQLCQYMPAAHREKAQGTTTPLKAVL